MKPDILHVCMKNKQDTYIIKSHRLHIYICTHYIYKNLTLCLSPSKPLLILNSFYPFTLSLIGHKATQQVPAKSCLNNEWTHSQTCSVCSQSITRKCKYLFQSDLIFSSDLPTWHTALSQRRLLQGFMFTSSSARRLWLTLVRSNFSMNPSRPWDCCEPPCGKEVALDSSEWSLTVQIPLPILKTLLGESSLELGC